MTRPSAAQADQSSGSTEAAGPSEAEQHRPEDAPRAASRPEERRSVVTRSPEGDPATGVALDAAFVFAGVGCVEGWFFGGDGLEIILDAAGPATAHTMMFERPDVTAGFKLTQARARGFVAVYTSESVIDHIRVRIAGAPESDAALIAVKRRERAEVVAFVEQKQWLAGFLFKHTVKSSEWTSIVAPRVGAAPESFKKARAYIEQAKAASEIGGLVVGWAVCEPSCELVAVCDGGSSCGLQDGVRWTRDDIIKVFGGEFGAFTADAGFLLALHGDPAPAAQVRVIAIYGDTAYSLAASAWTIVPADPASFTRWSFTLPTEAQDFQRRLEQHDGPIIHKLIQQKNRSIAQLKSQRLDFGLPIDNPVCSLSIPLYGRYDFMLHQMLEMSDDLFIREKVEIIYVVDDPRIREAVIKEAHELHRRFGLSFSVVVSGINRGFSAATNLGVSHSSGTYVVLMNSDVIPIRPGWLEAMIRVLETNPGVGAVGPRLLYPNGTVQHDGMDFEWEPTFAAHLNQHPGMGRLPSPVSPAAVTRKAITGACMMLRRGVYDGVGRLDDTFLIGDFEDSDLCLKIREAGMEVALVQDVLLVHLERQSFRDIGVDLFRERVVRYNAWRHEQRWRKKITELRSFASRRLGE